MITRERLLDGSLLAEWRAAALPGAPLRSDAEIEASLADALSRRPGNRGADVWVFGYGSLIWNPTFLFDERQAAVTKGWHRRFCIWTRTGRGTPDRPGLTLALDRGGACRGVAFRIPAEQTGQELLLLWRREMASGVYDARWASLRLADGRRTDGLTFVANRSHERYVRDLTTAEIASCLATARGPLGTCAEYFHNTVEHLDQLGLPDNGLHRIRREMGALTAQPTVAA